ncbi:LysR family transcriptional regulator [Nicoliella spurrieriana]|uniref:LysR family transcriptional regulator n=1 Tax=Nicoliella spurrieriana TaxID=2925830 RepID=A0A976RT40_9LACO|nr:LysR family transcriptional regulator [Nicoliella spurrieriana]UQS87370.1 LysR family transcriptional regulator [Nicoliella spurrieriana]
MFKYFLAFRAVYENRNFSQAAKQLFVSQSSISQQIKKLETLLNGQLFTRNSRSQVVPTGLAEQLYAAGVSIFEKEQALQRQLTNHHPHRIPCRIGISNTTADVVITTVLKQLKIPQSISLELTVTNSTVIAEQMENHQLEFGLIEKAIVTPNIERTAFQTDVLVHAGNFNSDTWLERENGSGVYHYTEEFFKQRNFAPANRILIDNNDLIVRLLAAGIGQSIISRDVLPVGIPFEPLDSNFERQFFFLNRANYPFPELTALQQQLLKAITNS